MERRKIKKAHTYIVNMDGKVIHTKPPASESCNTDDARTKRYRSGEQLRTPEYADYDLCQYCFG